MDSVLQQLHSISCGSTASDTVATYLQGKKLRAEERIIDTVEVIESRWQDDAPITYYCRALRPSTPISTIRNEPPYQDSSAKLHLSLTRRERKRQRQRYQLMAQPTNGQPSKLATSTVHLELFQDRHIPVAKLSQTHQSLLWALKPCLEVSDLSPRILRKVF